ncbi:MAG: transglycosylase SLT domain-containing protein [Candidatus Sungbacteria bacterium]|nr:transglycosylase SLT domain-containing protein [Candidatus Sungbacteria bacterium]
MGQKNIALLIILAGIAIAVPFIVSAVDLAPLVTCGVHMGQGQGTPGKLSPMTNICSICDLFALLQKGFNFIWLYLSIPIAAVMIFYGGFLMIMGGLGGQVSSITKGKSVLKNVFLGLAIVFFAWIGVDSILKFLGAQQSGYFRPWNKIVCNEEAARIPTFGGPVDVIPVELQCPKGFTTKDAYGFDVCDPGVKQAIQDRSSVMGARAGSCSTQSISPPLDTAIAHAAQRHGIPPNRFRALVLTESSANPNAKNCGKYGCACGITQVLPSTARQSCEWLQTAENGLEAGATEYAKLLNKCGGNHDCAALGYNGGPAAIEQSTVCPPGFLAGNCPKNSGWQESRNYVQKLNSCQSKLGG